MIKQIAVCDNCGKILDNNKGITIQGNIYVAGNDKGGLIGDNFKENKVDQQDFCAKCFIKGMTPEFKEELKQNLIPTLREETKRLERGLFDLI